MRFISYGLRANSVPDAFLALSSSPSGLFSMIKIYLAPFWMRNEDLGDLPKDSLSAIDLD